MKNGFLRDLHHHRIESAFWIEGPIERSFFGNVKLKGRAKGEVQALRCDTCGRIELFVPALAPA